MLTVAMSLADFFFLLRLMFRQRYALYLEPVTLTSAKPSVSLDESMQDSTTALGYIFDLGMSIVHHLEELLLSAVC